MSIPDVTHRPGEGGMRKRYAVALIPVGIVLNLVLGTLVHTLKLPVYVDAVGTIVTTLVAGLPAGIIVGVASFLLGGILTNPVLPWFVGTQAVIAIYTHIVAMRGGFSSVTRTILSGVGLGIVAGIVSAPVIVHLFGGITGSGASLIVAYLLATGKGVLKSVVMSGLAAEPIDKTIQCLLAVWLLKGMPRSLLVPFQSTALRRNRFIRD